MTLPLYIPGAQLPKTFTLEGLNDEPRVLYAGKMKYVHSTSELKIVPPSHKGCPRKWALMYLGKLPKIPNEALIDGILLHSCIHDWFVMVRAGRLDDWKAKWQISAKSQTGRERSWYARLGLAMLRHVTEVEKRILLSEPTYFLEIPELSTALYIKPDALMLKKFDDWKSTAAVTKKSEWVLQQQDWWTPPIPPDRYFIHNDIQSRVYAHGLMSLFGWDLIDASWVYGSKKFTGSSQVKTWTCEARFEREETGRWVKENVYPLIVFMNALKDAWVEKRLDSPMLVPHSSKACEGKGKFCDAFGTCRLYQSPIPLSALNLPVIPN